MTGTEFLHAAQIVTPVVLAVFGYLIKRSIGQMDARQEAAEERIRALEENTVTKEDWLREAGASRKRLDEIAEGIAELKGRQEQAVDIAAAVAAALNAQREKVNR